MFKVSNYYENVSFSNYYISYVFNGQIIYNNSCISHKIRRKLVSDLCLNDILYYCRILVI